MALFPDKIDQNFQSKELIPNSNKTTQDMTSPSNPENHDDEVPIDENLSCMRSEPNISLSNKDSLASPRINLSNSSPGLKSYPSLPGQFPFSLNSPRSKPSISNSSSTGHGPNGKVCISPLLPSPKKGKSNIPFGPSHVGSQNHHASLSDSQHAHFNTPNSTQPNKHLQFGPSTPISHISSQQPSLQQQQQANSMLGRRKTSPLIQNSLLQSFKNSNSQMPHDHESDQEIEQNANLIKQYIKDLEENHINRGNYVPDSGSASPDDADATNNHQIEEHKNTPSSNDNSESNTVEKENNTKDKEKSDSNSKLLEEKSVVKLYQIISKPSCLINMKEDLLNELINSVKRIMSINIAYKIPHKYIYSDQVVNLRLTNWPEFQYIHKILLLILHHGNRRIINEVFINQDFAHLLFEYYNSPEPEERLMIDDIFHFLSDSFQTFNRFIYHECFTRVLNHIQDDKESFYCVTPALNYLYNFFNSNSTILVMNHNSKLHSDSHYSIMNSDKIKKSNSGSMEAFDDQSESVIPNQEANYIDIFQRYLLPLFSSNFLPAFYSQLSQICSQFYGFFDQEAPLLSINYLLNHWPTTNSQKQTIFINHIGVVLPFISSDNIEKIASPIFNRFALCLQCNNYKVTNSTLNLINNETFFSTFSSYPKIIIPIIVPQLLGLDEHWCSDLNGKHINLLQRLMALQPETYTQTQSKYEENKKKRNNGVANPKNEEEINTWKLVIETANEFYKEINIDDYSNSIKFIETT